MNDFMKNILNRLLIRTEFEHKILKIDIFLKYLNNINELQIQGQDVPK